MPYRRYRDEQPVLELVEVLRDEGLAVVGLVMFIAIFYSIVGALVLTPLMLRFWGPKGAPEGTDQG